MGGAKTLAVIEQEMAEFGFAKPHCVHQHRLEYRLKLAWRRTDGTQHIGRCGLLLERLAQVAQQPRVLDGDHRLRGEVPDEFDLLLRERPYLLAINDDRAHDSLAF